MINLQYEPMRVIKQSENIPILDNLLLNLLYISIKLWYQINFPEDEKQFQIVSTNLLDIFQL